MIRSSAQIQRPAIPFRFFERVESSRNRPATKTADFLNFLGKDPVCRFSEQFIPPHEIKAIRS